MNSTKAGAVKWDPSIDLPPSDLWHGCGDDSKTEDKSGKVKTLSAIQSLIQAHAHPKSSISRKHSHLKEPIIGS